MLAVFVSVPVFALAQNGETETYYKDTYYKDNNKASAWNRFMNWFRGEHENSNSEEEDNYNEEIVAHNRTFAPTISGITAPTTLLVGQTGTWTVNASDPQNDTLSYSVNWGDNAYLGMEKMMRNQAFVQTSTFTHSYANPGKYKVVLTVENGTGEKTVSSVSVYVTGTSVGQAPVISNLTATTKLNQSKQASITWATNVRGTSLVWYSTTSPVNTSLTPNISRPAKVLNHIINSSRLTPGTTYYVVVGSANQYGTTLSPQISFTTNPQNDSEDTTKPVINNINLSIGSTSGTVSWSTNEPATSKVFYSVNTPVNVVDPNTPVVTDGTFTTSHSLTLPGLTPSTLYHFLIVSADASGNTNNSSEYIFMTTSS
jgi:hypothetical protein